MAPASSWSQSSKALPWRGRGHVVGDQHRSPSLGEWNTVALEPSSKSIEYVLGVRGGEHLVRGDSSG